MIPARARAPGLDVVRVVAILLVVLHHFRHLPGAPESLRWFALRGYVGVDLFFVLSGWLIGGQLWRERATSGHVDVLRFWKRRWWRTLPAYFAVLALLVVLGRVGPGALPAMLTFTQNYAAPSTWLASWSLCIEEQFYLLLPLAVLAGGDFRLRNKALMIVLVALVASPILRALVWASGPPASYDAFLETFYVRTHLRLDGLALGLCLSALAAHGHAAWTWLDEHRHGLALAGLVLVSTPWWPFLAGATSNPLERMTWFNAVPGFFLVSLGTALVIPLAASWNAPGRLGRAWAVFADHAYATYLVHELARDAVVALVGSRAMTFGGWLAACVVATALGAAALRGLVELPGLRWRDARGR